MASLRSARSPLRAIFGDDDVARLLAQSLQSTRDVIVVASICAEGFAL